MAPATARNERRGEKRKEKYGDNFVALNLLCFTTSWIHMMMDLSCWSFGAICFVISSYMCSMFLLDNVVLEETLHGLTTVFAHLSFVWI